MKRKKYVGIRTKIAVYTVLCVITVGLLTNVFLFQYMQRIIEEKVASIDSLYAKTISAQLNYGLEWAETLNAYCANADDAANVLQNTSLDSIAARNAALVTQNSVTAYLRTSPVGSYVNKLFFFNEDKVIIHAVTTYPGTPTDYQRLMKSEQYGRWSAGGMRPFDQVYPSLNPGGPECFVFLTEVYTQGSYARMKGYVYIEVDTRLVTDILAPYNQANRFFALTAAGDRLLPGKDGEFLKAAAAAENDSFQHDGDVYTVKNYPLGTDALSLSSCTNLTELMANNHDMLFSVVMVTVMIISIVAVVLVVLTRYITTPISRIMDKINRISLNDYSFDADLETPNNEMGEVGARLNELGMGIEKLLEGTIALHDERSEIEMALLQSQVNPHFLYNTLNSVHWMAVMQKNTGIEKVIKSLVNLLKNVSKGVSDRITLAEELSLLDDYVNIQSVRYMGVFDYVCNIPDEFKKYKIIKFTLQPLVENAMFHGVVPKGTFGTISVDAHKDEEYLVITVTDDGVGMLPEQAAALLKEQDRPGKSGMNGIGVANVNRRLKLTYGAKCGLSVESEKGQYTRISVHIPREA